MGSVASGFPGEEPDNLRARDSVEFVPVGFTVSKQNERVVAVTFLAAFRGSDDYLESCRTTESFGDEHSSSKRAICLRPTM